MSEARLLSLVLRHPHPTALARRVRDRSLHDGLRRLEANGLVRKQRGVYRLTWQGRRELATTKLLVRLLARS